jgi:hypothetical protein
MASDESATLKRMLLRVPYSQPNGQKEPAPDLRLQPETSAAGKLDRRVRGPNLLYRNDGQAMRCIAACYARNLDFMGLKSPGNTAKHGRLVKP